MATRRNGHEIPAYAGMTRAPGVMETGRVAPPLRKALTYSSPKRSL